jgi:hypothetical protein
VWSEGILFGRGEQGIQGIPGADSVVPGPQGIQGLVGLTGADSAVPGPIGPIGPDGLQGIQGIQGEPGADSIVPGPVGIQGIQGIQGATGADSTVPGPQGLPGADGIDGTGLPIGGTIGQIPSKTSNADFDIAWTDPAVGGALVPYQNEAPLTPADGDLWMDKDAVTPGATVFDMLSTLATAEISITGAVTATIGRMHFCTAAATNYAITLPAASGNVGKSLSFFIMPTSTFLVILTGSGAELIADLNTCPLWAGESVTLMCTGTGWAITASHFRAMQASLYAGAAQAWTGSLYTRLALDTQIVAPSVASMLDTANKRIYVRRKGVYTIGFYGVTKATGAAGRITVAIYINNFGYNTAEVSHDVAAGVRDGISITQSLLLNAGDYIEIFAAVYAGSYATSTFESGIPSTGLRIVENR